MTTDKNSEWLEAAYETFREAVEDKRIGFAKDIIQDTFDAGFTEDSRKMNLELREATREFSQEKNV